ncbi:hypothetical protein [Alicyclobacillus dauci]|uniref:HicA toxin of toxin-antitoxin n=1 Tax=Alicyclobacillus dauci TaxID=1475485 RepID=A0ABY6Z6U2_9BACL|nr:hypothetical protein [Alicyclobacillus dauci]WAH38596.1 hypothetical protein NZD86_08990 [Alicyclobacillus dauci]
MDEIERKFTMDLLEGCLNEEGYRVDHRWDAFTESSSALRVFPRRAENDRPTLRKSFIVKVMWQEGESE